MKTIIWAIAILASMWLVDTFPTVTGIMFLVAILYGIVRAIRWAWTL